MNSTRLMKIVGYLVFGSYAFFNVITLIFLTTRAQFGPEIAGPYSIFASQKFFVAYHVWGIIIALVCMYALAKEVRMLFMIGLFLMGIIMFYPYFTSSPMDKAKGRQMKQEELRRDSLRAADSIARLQGHAPQP